MNKKTFIGLNAFVALLLAWFAFQMYDINQKKEEFISAKFYLQLTINFI